MYNLIDNNGGDQVRMIWNAFPPEARRVLADFYQQFTTFEDLPNDILMSIVLNTSSCQDLVDRMNVCKKWRKVICDNLNVLPEVDIMADPMFLVYCNNIEKINLDWKLCSTDIKLNNNNLVYHSNKSLSLNTKLESLSLHKYQLEAYYLFGLYPNLKSLFLNDQHFSYEMCKEDFRHLASGISMCTKLEKLVFSSHWVDYSGDTEKIIKALCLPNLTSLTVLNSSINLKLLQSFTSLRKLKLPNSNIKDDQLKNLVHFTQLQELTIGGFISWRGFANLKHTSNLTKLRLTNLEVEVTPEHVKFCPSLRKLQVANITGGLKQYKKYCPLLETLEIKIIT
eukprot:TRINITY_DN24899_c0_g1_i1.p1 TRINITY_DN24899_c0_g1~~TRINITY_DN24899_c0_g1_i1.p1  ORF type:complete len:381 (+),score=76.14 TRINITY_DN24899_c0_g1_i1:132-1145(+)